MSFYIIKCGGALVGKWLLESFYELGCNVLNEVVIEEGYVRVTMRVEYKDIWMKKSLLCARYEV